MDLYKKIPACKHLKFLGATIVRKLVDLGIFLGTSGSLWIFLYPHAIISYHLPEFNYELYFKRDWDLQCIDIDVVDQNPSNLLKICKFCQNDRPRSEQTLTSMVAYF
jgi:hypothetical protein